MPLLVDLARIGGIPYTELVLYERLQSEEASFMAAHRSQDSDRREFTADLFSILKIVWRICSPG